MTIPLKSTLAVLGALLALSIAAIPATGSSSATNGRIAFNADVEGTPQVFTIGPDGTGLTQITHGRARRAEYGTAWLPDGSALLFSAGTSRGDVIFRAAPDGSGLVRLSPRCAKLCLGDDFPAISPSGAKVAFERALGPETNGNAAASGIFTMSARGSGLRQLTQRKRPTSSEDHRPSWSPDGRRIAFQRVNTSARPRSLGAIFVINADGSHARRITAWSLNASNPHWSRDGTRILFNTYAEPVAGKSANLHTIRPDGTGLTPVTHYAGGMLQAFPNDWSPDGTQILFHLVGTDAKAAEVNQIYVVNADGTGAHPLTSLGKNANPRNSSWGTAR